MPQQMRWYVSHSGILQRRLQHYQDAAAMSRQYTVRRTNMHCTSALAAPEPAQHACLPSRQLHLISPAAEQASVVQVVVLAFFFVLSVTPLLSRRHTLLWRLAMQATILAHAARLYKAVGIPYLWPLSFAEFKVWFKNVSQYSDLHYLLTGFMFLPQRPFMPALVSPVVLAVMREAAFCKEKLGGDSRVGKLCDRVLSSNARVRAWLGSFMWSEHESCESSAGLPGLAFDVLYHPFADASHTVDSARSLCAS